MSGPRVGVAAIAEAAAAVLPPAEKQLELLPTRFEPGTAEHTEQIERVRRVGRPLGARNLAQKAAIELTRRLFGDPWLERARWLLHSPETLARELRCSPLEAFILQDKIRSDLMRYIYATRSPEDGAGNPIAPTFAVQIGAAGAAVTGPDAKPPWEYEGGPELPKVVNGEPGENDAEEG
jgi:hypothetical protein